MTRNANRHGWSIAARQARSLFLLPLSSVLLFVFCVVRLLCWLCWRPCCVCLVAASCVGWCEPTYCNTGGYALALLNDTASVKGCPLLRCCFSRRTTVQQYSSQHRERAHVTQNNRMFGPVYLDPKVFSWFREHPVNDDFWWCIPFCACSAVSALLILL